MKGCGKVRQDGRKIHPVHLMEVKGPGESSGARHRVTRSRPPTKEHFVDQALGWREAEGCEVERCH